MTSGVLGRGSLGDEDSEGGMKRETCQIVYVLRRY